MVLTLMERERAHYCAMATKGPVLWIRFIEHRVRDGLEFLQGLVARDCARPLAVMPTCQPRAAGLRAMRC